MVRDDLQEQRIKWMVGWKPDSSQFERYSHVTDEEMMRGILDHYGLAEPDAKIGTPDLSECPRCYTPLGGPVDPEFCPSCGLALTPAAADSADIVCTQAVDDLADPDTPDTQRDPIRKILDAIENNPEVAAAVTDAARESDSASAND